MITTATLRTQINDVPRVFPPTSAAPEVLGLADGVTTNFFLSYANVVPGSLTIFTTSLLPSSAGPASPVGVASSAYSQSGAQVTFAAAPAASGAGMLSVSARYQATYFADADLAPYLANAIALYGSDDVSALKRAQYDVIPVLLMNRDRFVTLHYGDFSEEGAAWATALTAIQKQLWQDLEGGPTPGRTTPVFLSGATPARGYGTRR